MPDQDALIPGRPADDGGLWRRYLNHGAIDHGNWLRARAEHSAVGTCRLCAADLVPQPPHDRGNGRLDYEAACSNPACGWTLLAPGGRVMRGSTSWSKSGGAARAAAIHRHAKEATD